jgi:hypothetical protein
LTGDFVFEALEAALLVCASFAGALYAILCNEGDNRNKAAAGTIHRAFERIIRRVALPRP